MAVRATAQAQKDGEQDTAIAGKAAASDVTVLQAQVAQHTADIAAKASPGDIAAAVAGLASEAWVSSQLSSATNGLATTADLATKAQASAVTQLQSDLATKLSAASLSSTLASYATTSALSAVQSSVDAILAGGTGGGGGSTSISFVNLQSAPEWAGHTTYPLVVPNSALPMVRNLHLSGALSATVENSDTVLSLTCDAPSAAQVDASIAAALAPYNLQADHDADVASLQTQIDNKQATLLNNPGEGLTLLQGGQLRRIIAEDGLSASIDTSRDSNLVLSGAALQADIATLTADLASASASVTQNAMTIAQLQNRTEYEITRIFSLSPGGQTISLSVEFTAGAMRIDVPLTLTQDLTAPNVYSKTEVDGLLAALVNGAPAALDTLNELAAALGDDANFAATITNALAGKQATLTSQAGGGVTLFHSSSVLRRLIAAGGLTVEVPINVADPSDPQNFNIVVSGAALQSAIAAVEADVALTSNVSASNAAAIAQLTRSPASSASLLAGKQSH